MTEMINSGDFPDDPRKNHILEICKKEFKDLKDDKIEIFQKLDVRTRVILRKINISFEQFHQMYPLCLPHRSLSHREKPIDLRKSLL